MRLHRSQTHWGTLLTSPVFFRVRSAALNCALLAPRILVALVFASMGHTGRVFFIAALWPARIQIAP